MKVLVVSGTSGGHIFPALAFLDSLRQRDKDIETLLILPKNNLIAQLSGLTYKARYLSIYPIKLSLSFKNFIGIFKFFKASLQSLLILMEFHPDAVIGFGSLPCVPIVLFAWIFRIKTLIHEQNILPGKANILLAPFVDRIAVSFKETENYLEKYKRKIVFTGNPLRNKLQIIQKNKALDFFRFSQDRFTLLVMGGSMGSSRINESFQQAISDLRYKNNLQVIHITGRRDYDSLKQRYEKSDINLRIFDFLGAIEYAYSACDLIISRSGALTIAEIMFFKLPALLIPYPYAHKHQAANAQILVRLGSAIVIEDNKLEKEVLKDTLEELIVNPDKLRLMHLRYDNMHFPDANSLLAELAISLN